MAQSDHAKYRSIRETLSSLPCEDVDLEKLAAAISSNTDARKSEIFLRVLMDDPNHSDAKLEQIEEGVTFDLTNFNTAQVHVLHHLTKQLCKEYGSK